MSVIVGDIPDARDGLKPYRKILFAMYELGLTPDNHSENVQGLLECT